MNHTTEGKPKELKTTRLLLGEGKEESRFFDAFLRHLGLAGVQLEDYGGKNQLALYLRTLRNRPGFAQLERLGVTRDADEDPGGAVESVKAAIQSAQLPGSLDVQVHILPGSEERGSLETLCLRTLNDTRIAACMEDYFKCAAAARDSATPASLPEATRAKARIHAWLATQERPGLRLGEAAASGLVNWDAPCFEPLRQFLRELHEL